MDPLCKIDISPSKKKHIHTAVWVFFGDMCFRAEGKMASILQYGF